MAISPKVKLLIALLSLNILLFSQIQCCQTPRRIEENLRDANTKDKQIQEELEITGLNLQVECGSSTNQTNQMILCSEYHM